MADGRRDVFNPRGQVAVGAGPARSRSIVVTHHPVLMARPSDLLPLAQQIDQDSSWGVGLGDHLQPSAERRDAPGGILAEPVGPWSLSLSPYLSTAILGVSRCVQQDRRQVRPRSIE